MPLTKIAAALAGSNNDDCLNKIETVRSFAAVAEVRLDLMAEFDVIDLVKRSPLPLVMTHRPHREGGQYSGPEDERLDVLHKAVDAGVAYIDVELDALDSIADWDLQNTKVIASHHDFDSMPSSFIDDYEALRNRCDVVKFVGTAKSATDNRAVFDLFAAATTPVISMAMGEAGRITRLLAPYFESCLFTYGSASDAEATAPGQLSVRRMVEEFGIDHLSPASTLHFGAGEEWRITWTDSFARIEVPQFHEMTELIAGSFPHASVE